MWQIEPIPPDQLAVGLALVVGAGRTGPKVTAGVSNLQMFLTEPAHREAHPRWWALGAGSPVAAAVAMATPGRLAVVLHSSTEAGLVPPEPLTAVLAAVATEALNGNSLLVQSLLSPGSAGDIQAFEQAGYERLAELVYMRRLLRRRPIRLRSEVPAVAYDRYSEASHADFAAAIEASYRGSLDCPALEGLRNIEDVLAGHKAAGVFREDMWTCAYLDGQPVGVVLLNPCLADNQVELVYMGVAHTFRGRSIGRALLARAGQLAVAEGFDAISLAVDSRNHHAMRLYERSGFVETFRRLAYMRTRRSPPLPRT